MEKRRAVTIGWRANYPGAVAAWSGVFFQGFGLCCSAGVPASVITANWQAASGRMQGPRAGPRVAARRAPVTDGQGSVGDALDRLADGEHSLVPSQYSN